MHARPEKRKASIDAFDPTIRMERLDLQDTHEGLEEEQTERVS